MGGIEVVTIQFTSLLKRFFPNLKTEEIEANTVAELVMLLDKTYPGLKAYLVEEQGSLRKHVNIFVNGTMIKDRINLSDRLLYNDQVNIIQALSGG